MSHTRVKYVRSSQSDDMGQTYKTTGLCKTFAAFGILHRAHWSYKSHRYLRNRKYNVRMQQIQIKCQFMAEVQENYFSTWGRGGGGGKWEETKCCQSYNVDSKNFMGHQLPPRSLPGSCTCLRCSAIINNVQCLEYNSIPPRYIINYLRASSDHFALIYKQVEHKTLMWVVTPPKLHSPLCLVKMLGRSLLINYTK